VHQVSDLVHYRFSGPCSRRPFNLREQVSKLVITKLTIFPADLDAGKVLDYYLTLHSVRDPDHYLMGLEVLGFLRIHTNN
jgi:hypothetical protein